MHMGQPWLIDRIIEERQGQMIVDAENSRKLGSRASGIDVRRALGGVLVSAGQRIAGSTIDEQRHSDEGRRLSSAG